MKGQNPAFCLFAGFFTAEEESQENLKDVLVLRTEQREMGKGSITQTQSKFQKTLRN